MYLFSYIPSTANTLRGRAGPVHEDTLSVAFDEAPSLACRVVAHQTYKSQKICWIPKATNSIPFPSLRNKRFKRFREAMIERDARILFEGHLWLPSFIQLTLFWVRSLAIELKVSICPVQDSVMELVPWSNPEFLQQQQKKRAKKKSQSLESAGLQQTWPAEAASPIHSSTYPTFLPWPCVGCRKSLFHWPPFFRNQEVTRGASWPRPRRCPVRKKARISFPFLALRKKFKKWRES